MKVKERRVYVPWMKRGTLRARATRGSHKALWDTGRFNDIQVKKETGARGGVVVRFVVTEQP